MLSRSFTTLPAKSKWGPIFFALFRSSRKVVSEEDRHSSFPSKLTAASDPDAGQPEARAGIVALMSCCLVRLSNGCLGRLDEIALSLLACTQRSICRGAALASLLDPLTLSGDKRRRSKALFSLCSTEQIQNLSIFHSTQRTGSTDKLHPAKDTFSARISSAACAAIVPLLDWLPACVAHDFCNSEDPDALGDDSSFFAVTQQQCLCSQNVTLQTGLHIATFLTGFQNSFWSFRGCEGRMS